MVECGAKSESGKNKEEEREGEGAREREALLPPTPLPRYFSCSHLFAPSQQSEHLKQATCFLENGPLTSGKTILFVFLFPQTRKLS